MQWIYGFFLVLVIAPASLAATIRVGVGPSADFTSIQAAVDAASDGDVINVDVADYKEQITVRGKNITIKATGVGDGTSPLPSILPNNIVANAQTADGREISALLLVEDAWVEIRNMRISGFSLSLAKRRATDIFAGIAVIGENSGIDVQDSIIRTINKGSNSLPRVEVFPTNCTDDIRDPNRGVGILAIDSLSVSVTNTTLTSNLDGVAAICVRDLSFQSNTVVGTGMVNQGVGVTVAGDAARIVKNKFGANWIDMLIKGNENRVLQNGSYAPDVALSNIGIVLEGDRNILYGNVFWHTQTDVVDSGTENTVYVPKGRRTRR